MSVTRTKKEGRVNVPLGEKKKDLVDIAKREGTTETALARLILSEGIDSLKSGATHFNGPKLIQSEPTA